MNITEQLPQNVSKIKISKVIMPEVGSIIENKYKINYINYSQFRITCTGNELPSIGTKLEYDGRKFQVNHINFKKNRFTADFIDYEEPKLQNESEEVISLID